MKALQSSPQSRAYSRPCSTFWPAVSQRHVAAQLPHRSVEQPSFRGSRRDLLHARSAACVSSRGHRLQCRAAGPLHSAPLEETYSKTAGKALGINLDLRTMAASRRLAQARRLRAGSSGEGFRCTSGLSHICHDEYGARCCMDAGHLECREMGACRCCMTCRTMAVQGGRSGWHHRQVHLSV